MRALRDSVNDQTSYPIDQENNARHDDVSPNTSKFNKDFISSTEKNSENDLGSIKNNDTSNITQSSSTSLITSENPQKACTNFSVNKTGIVNESVNKVSINPKIIVDTYKVATKNIQPESSDQCDSSKMTPEELRKYMLSNKDDNDKILHSESIPTKPVQVTHQEVEASMKNSTDDSDSKLCDKYEPKERRNLPDDVGVDRSTRKKFHKEDTSDHYSSKKMRTNCDRLDMISTSISTSKAKAQEFVILTNYDIQLNYKIRFCNSERFKQVSLQDAFDQLLPKYKTTDVRFIFSRQEIESTIQHVVSKVKEFSVIAYAEDQNIRVSEVAGDAEKRKRRGWIDSDDSSTDSEKFSSESKSDCDTRYPRRPRPHFQEIKWYDQLTSEDTFKLVSTLINSHVWDFGERIRKIYPECKKRNEHICSFCPFNKEFHPYFEACGVMRLIRKYDLDECIKKKSICFSANTALKQHCINSGYDLGHKMLLFIIKYLYEGRPLPYGPTEPIKNVIELQEEFEMEKKKNFFNVKR